MISIRLKIKVTLTLLTSFILSLSSYADEPDSLKVGYFVYPPHVFYSEETGEPHGPLIFFFTEYFAKNMGVNIVWQKMTNKRSELSLKQCKIDMFLLKGWSKERTALMLYPDHPFHHVIPSLLVKKDFPVDKIRGSEDLYDQVIGWTNGLPASLLKPYWQHPRIKLVLTPQTDFYSTNMKMFVLGRLTGVASSNKESLFYMAKKMNLLEEIKIIPLPQEARYVYHAFSKCSKNQLDNYNKVSQSVIEKEFNGQTIADYYYQYLLTKIAELNTQ